MQQSNDQTASVTILNTFRSVMRDQILHELLSYWESLRAGRLAPLRSELDPQAFRTALDNSFILQQTRTGDLRIRLAGTKLCDRMGMEMRGMPADAMIVPNSRLVFREALNRVLQEPLILELSLTQTTSQPAARMLLLPLADDTGAVTRILGALSVENNAKRPPNRYSIIDTRETRIVAGETAPRPTGFAEPPVPFQPASSTPPNGTPDLKAVDGGKAPRRPIPRRTGHLRLVKDE